MRAYFFINCYLSQIQQGIQSAHILGEMVRESDALRIHRESMESFLEHHKTIIVCNGGNNDSIRELVEFFADERNPYQFATFNEDEGSLDGALTGVGILLPEEVYLPRWDREKGCYILERVPGYTNEITLEKNGYFFELTDKIKSFRLA